MQLLGSLVRVRRSRRSRRSCRSIVPSSVESSSEAQPIQPSPPELATASQRRRERRTPAASDEARPVYFDPTLPARAASFASSSRRGTPTNAHPDAPPTARVVELTIDVNRPRATGKGGRFARNSATGTNEKRSRGRVRRRASITPWRVDEWASVEKVKSLFRGANFADTVKNN